MTSQHSSEMVPSCRPDSISLIKSRPDFIMTKPTMMSQHRKSFQLYFMIKSYYSGKPIIIQFLAYEHKGTRSIRKIELSNPVLFRLCQISHGNKKLEFLLNKFDNTSAWSKMSLLNLAVIGLKTTVVNCVFCAVTPDFSTQERRHHPGATLLCHGERWPLV